MLWNIIVFILLGAAAGWLAGNIFGGKGGSFLYNLIIGVVGSLVAGLLLPAWGGSLGAFVNAVVGGIVLLWLIRLVKK